jgi:hypothetical protein
MQAVSKNFALVLQMLLCGECYENVYALKKRRRRRRGGIEGGQTQWHSTLLRQK